MSDWRYDATLVAVLDGDTIDVDLDLGFDVKIRERLRFLGINAPEIHSLDAAEKLRGQASRAALISYLQNRKLEIVTVPGDKQEKYGRYLAEVFADGDPESVNSKMVKGGFAVLYSGGKR